MKNISKIILTLLIISMFSCKSVDIQNEAPLQKVENYTKGKLDLMVAPFGLNGNEINVGNISEDGILHFRFPQIDLSKIEGSEYYLESIDRAVGMTFCNNKQIESFNKTIKVVDTKNIFLYKDGIQVGSLYPATKKEIEDNGSLNRYTSLVLGSYISWFYSDGAGIFKASCGVSFDEEYYKFEEVSEYNLKFKKGWNIVEHKLLEKQDWKNDASQGSLPKVMEIKTTTTIPKSINWYVKYWGK
ncbi:MAG: hypothetical protein V3V16_13380 [Melioribacteraceae bacterium]